MYTGTSKDTLKDVKTSASNIRDEAVDTAYGVQNDLSKAANQAGKKVRSFFSNATDELTHAGETVTTQVRNNPVQSSLIALGAGFILGALFRR